MTDLTDKVCVAKWVSMWDVWDKPIEFIRQREEMALAWIKLSASCLYWLDLDGPQTWAAIASLLNSYESCSVVFVPPAVGSSLFTHDYEHKRPKQSRFDVCLFQS